MGLGLSVRITLAINQRHIHQALYGSMRLLEQLYPRPFLSIGDSSDGYMCALKYFRFPVSEYHVAWSDLNKQKQDMLLRAAAKGEFGGVHIEVSDSSWLRSHRPELRNAAEPLGKSNILKQEVLCRRLEAENDKLQGALDIFEHVILHRGSGTLGHRTNSLVYLADMVTDLWKKYELNMSQTDMCRHGGECGHRVCLLSSIDDMRSLNARCTCTAPKRGYRTVPSCRPTGFNREWGKIVMSRCFTWSDPTSQEPWRCLNDRDAPVGLIPLTEASGVAYMHIDDGVVASASPVVTDALRGACAEECRRNNYVVKEEIPTEEAPKQKHVGLAHTVTPAHLLPPLDKLVLVYETAKYLAEVPGVFVDPCASFLGVVAWLFCTRRISLARLEYVFAFVQESRGKWKVIPKRVRREFKGIRDLVGLILADVGAPLSKVVWACDAEGGGTGFGSPEAGTAGQMRTRWVWSGRAGLTRG